MGKLDHCKKMLKKLKAKIRNQTRCKRSYCNHKKNEHNGEIISNEPIGGGRRALTLVTKTLCSHVKRYENEEPVFCDCRYYL